jgi:hypothetical protein
VSGGMRTEHSSCLDWTGLDSGARLGWCLGCDLACSCLGGSGGSSSQGRMMVLGLTRRTRTLGLGRHKGRDGVEGGAVGGRCGGPWTVDRGPWVVGSG